MAARWTDRSPIDHGPGQVAWGRGSIPGRTRELDRGVLPIRPRPGCRATPYFRGTAGTRWWRCSCGQVIHRLRPKPYPARHA